MSGPRRLLLVRHGVTDWNREGRFQGHLDPPLADQGREQAKLLGRRLAASPTDRPARIIASSLGRARQTAELIAAELNTAGPAPQLQLEPRLIEIGQGEWEGRTHTDLKEHDRERYAAWRRRGRHAQPPGGEPIEDAMRRVNVFLDELLAGEGAWPACLVSHGGTLRLAARRLLDLSAERAWGLDLDNASLSSLVLTDDGEWQLERWNDARHLLGRAPTHVDESDGQPLAL